ncbi:3526_t:CDS:2, partial [Dentiscutata erythropus]
VLMELAMTKLIKDGYFFGVRIVNKKINGFKIKQEAIEFKVEHNKQTGNRNGYPEVTYHSTQKTEMKSQDFRGDLGQSPSFL